VFLRVSPSIKDRNGITDPGDPERSAYYIGAPLAFSTFFARFARSESGGKLTKNYIENDKNCLTLPKQWPGQECHHGPGAEAHPRRAQLGREGARVVNARGTRSRWVRVTGTRGQDSVTDSKHSGSRIRLRMSVAVALCRLQLRPR